MALETTEHHFSTPAKAKEKSVSRQSSILDAVREWKSSGENLLESLGDWVSGIEAREKSLRLATDSLEKGLKDLADRDSEIEVRKGELASKEGELGPLLEEFMKGNELREEKLDEQFKLVNEHIQNLEEAQNEVQELKLLEYEKLKEIERREREVSLIQQSLEKRLGDIEQREREVGLMQQSLENRLSDFEQREREVGLTQHSLENRLSEIEQREREVGLIQQSLENRLSETEQREKEVDSFIDRKLTELVLKEEDLSSKKEEFVNKVELANEKFREREKLGKGLIRRLDSALDKLEGMKVTIDKRFEETKLRETAAHEMLIVFADEADLIREQLEKRIEEFEKMERGFSASLEDKMQHSGLKDQHPSVIREELLKEVKLVDEKLLGQQELGRQLLERLEELMAKKLNEIESLQLTLNVTSETFDAKDSDLVRESKDVGLQELEKSEKEFHLYQEEKERELELEGKKLELIVEELIQEVKCQDKRFVEHKNPKHALLVRLELVQSNLKNMNSKRCKAISSKQSGFDNCTEKKLSELESKAEKLGNQQKGIKANGENKYDSHTLHLAGKDQQPKWEVEKLELNGESSDVRLKGSELKQQHLTDPLDTHFCIEPMCSVGLKQTVDLRRLEAIIKNTMMDFKLMADQVSEVLLASPDPAMLVLDAMQWFHTHLMVNADAESNMRRTCTLLLNQLIKRSAKIHPCVREAAIKLANEWKSKIRDVDNNNTLQLLEFLHLLAAYNISSSFSKRELLGFLQTVAQHKQAPELCCPLDLTNNMQGFVQNLIQEKQYLLASTYIHECKLEKMFHQADVLNFYVKHVKMTAKAKCRREHYPIEAKVKAIADEIADLRAAIQHIVKLSLESEYSPDILMARIGQLESELASLKNGTSMPLPADLHKQEMSKTSPRHQDASKRKVKQTGEAGNEAMLVTRSQRPEQSSEGRTRKKHHGPFHEPLPQAGNEADPLRQTRVADEWPMRHDISSRKRHRINSGDFGPRRLPPKRHRWS